MPTEINWDEIARIAKENPLEFDRLAEQIIENCILQAPPERQLALRQMQWRIKRIIKKGKTPLGACYLLYPVMMQSAYELREKLLEFNTLIKKLNENT